MSTGGLPKTIIIIPHVEIADEAGGARSHTDLPKLCRIVDERPVP